MQAESQRLDVYEWEDSRAIAEHHLLRVSKESASNGFDDASFSDSKKEM